MAPKKQRRAAVSSESAARKKHKAKPTCTASAGTQGDPAGGSIEPPITKHRVQEVTKAEAAAATIRFESGQPCFSVRRDGSAWESEASGRLSAELSSGGDEPIRLLGTREALFEVRDPKVWRWLKRPVSSSRRENTKKHRVGVECFDRYGEPGNSSGKHVPVWRLVMASLDGRLATNQATLRVLECIDANQRPANVDRFFAPIMRTLVVPLPAREQCDHLRLELRVYATRLLFYMIADESVRTVIEGLTPAGTRTPCAVGPPCVEPPLFAHTKDANPTPFTIESVMRAAEHTGGPEADEPAGLALRMFPYQLQALHWMLHMENLEDGINSLFWERRAFADGGEWYYSPRLGECRLEAPHICRGGLLCDEMGLGKTLEIVALIVANPPVQAHRPTLIVLPNPLVSQWLVEMEKSAPALRVARFVAESDRATHRPLEVHSLNFDVVVTTYDVVRHRQHGEPLFRVNWHRIVLDEMQMVASPNTLLSKRCAALSGDLRWMVSGTPLSESIDDLNGELRFLRVLPFSLSDDTDGFWEHSINGPWTRREPDALTRLELLLRTVSLRRSKAQVYARGPFEGRSIIALPAREDRLVCLEPTGSEALVIRACEAVAAVAATASDHLRDLALRVARAASATLEIVDDRDLNELCRVCIRGSGADDRNARLVSGTSLTMYVPEALNPTEAISKLSSIDNSQGGRRQRAAREAREAREANQVSRRRVAYDGVTNVENFLSHGNEDVSRVHASTRSTSTLTLTERLHQTRARIMLLEGRRRDARNAVRDAVLSWMLAQYVLGNGDEELVERVASVTRETTYSLGGYNVAGRIEVCKRRFAALLLPMLLPKNDRFASFDGGGHGVIDFVISKIKAKSVFQWATAEKCRREALEIEGHVQLELRGLRQLGSRLEASAQALRCERDSKQKEALAAFAHVADLQREIIALGSDGIPDYVQAECAVAMSEFKIADTALNETIVRNSQFRQRDVDRAEQRRVEAKEQLEAAHRKRAEDADAAFRDRILRLGELETDVVAAWCEGNKKQRESRLAADRLGADATDEQKRLWSELQLRKPPTDSPAAAKIQFRAEERAFLNTLSLEARAFFAPKRDELDAELQTQVVQGGFRDLIILEEPKNRPLMTCPVCFCAINYESTTQDAQASALLFTGCLHWMCLSCAQQHTLTKGVDDATSQYRISRDAALERADQGQLDAPCVSSLSQPALPIV